MTGSGLGGGVIFVVATLLWAAVLVPSWMRRREFRAAERNALRLQRTLRVLAETSEVPDEVRLEATAKEALAHEKILRTARKQQEAERAAELADARASQVRAEIRAQQKRREERAAVRSSRLRKPMVRRIRATAALGAAMGVLGALIGAGVAIAGSGTAVLTWASLVGATSIGALVLLAPGRGRAKVSPLELEVCDEAAQIPAQAAVVTPDPAAIAAEAEASLAAHREAQRGAAERIELARALARARAKDAAVNAPRQRVNQPESMLLKQAPTPAEIAAKAAADAEPFIQQDPRVTQQLRREARLEAERERVERSVAGPARQAPSAAESQASARLKSMGVIGDTSEGALDVGGALRRRRIG